jgi:hypothetical protein
MGDGRWGMGDGAMGDGQGQQEVAIAHCPLPIAHCPSQGPAIPTTLEHAGIRANVEAAADQVAGG